MKVGVCGGFGEVGKNMTYVESHGEIVILDMGVYLPAIINLEEEERLTLSTKKLSQIGAIPDDGYLRDRKEQVKAIVLGHCHLDHIGAVGYLAGKYDCPVIGTPYTIEVLKSTLRDDEIELPNEFRTLNVNSIMKISKNISIEFINITHSTLQSVFVAVHTKEGIVMYANDFKFDKSPTLGKEPNFARLKELKGKIRMLVVESLYADRDGKTPSETVAKELLKDVLLGTDNKGHIVFVTTFASHIPRLKTILEYGKRMRRKVVFLGRSMGKYISAAEKLGLVNFRKEAELVVYKKKIKAVLKRIEKNRGEYLIICTGNQGEPHSVLDRLVNKEYEFNFLPEDHVVFSCATIPEPINIANREVLERKLKREKVRIFTNIHVSVLPDTEVVINDNKTMKVKKICDLKNNEKIKTAAFDPETLKIKWLDANLIKHNYSGDIYTIKTKTGRNVNVTSGHSLFMLKDGKVKPIKSDLLKEGDFLAIPRKFKWRKTLKKIDMVDYLNINDSAFCRLKIDDKCIYYSKKKIIPRYMKLDKNFARFLGYYLAEGSSPRHISLVFGAKEREFIEKNLIPTIKKIFPYSNVKLDKYKGCEIQFGAHIIKRIMKNWFGSNARTKKIPDFVFSTNDDFKLNFLASYLDGDGTPDHGKKFTRIRVKTASKKLASDLLYLCSQLGICAKFDHIEIGKERMIGKSKKLTKETTSYVIRIQGREDLEKLYPYVTERFKVHFRRFFLKLNYIKCTYPPLSLPIKEIDLNEIITKKDTYLDYIKKYNKNKKNPSIHIPYRILKRDSLKIGGNLKKLIDGDLLFDPIKKIEKKYYKGEVYDLEVPGAENFIGGFGGIFLHNSGHASREDLRDLIKMVKPDNIIPAHGNPKMMASLANIAIEMDYKIGKDLHILYDGQSVEI